MCLLTNILNEIRDFICGDYDSCRKQLNFITRENAKNLAEIKRLNEVLKKQEKSYKSKINALERKIRALESESQEHDDVKAPKWLNTDVLPYQPLIQVLEKSGSSVSKHYVKIRPQDLYVCSPSLVKLVKDMKWRELEHDKKLRSIWIYIITNYHYAFDESENWQYPVTTFFRREGDCEDTTTLFVTLCKIAGVPADKVFNATGWFYPKTGGRIGHSFPIAQMSDGKWYVFESTLTSIPMNPKLFKGSEYDASWGVSNWKFAGRIKCSGDRCQI